MVKKKSYSFFLTAIIIVFLDQISKFFVKNNLSFVTNTGSLFGLFKGSSTLLVWFSVLVIGIFLYNIGKIQKSGIYARIASGLIVGGAIGNLIDRIIYGSVIDFIKVGIWPTFNIADSAITVGVVLLIVYIIREDI